MRKLILTCGSCGQRMQVPRSAIGRTGLCPTCGATVAINSSNASPQPSGQARRSFFGARGPSAWRGQGQPPEEAKRLFGQAVDLYYSEKYGEALAIFNDLIKQYPDNPEIEHGRSQCLRALRRPPARRHMAIEDKSDRVKDATLDENTVRRVILEKMVAGDTEAIQLQAAELACKLLGMISDGKMRENPRHGSTGDTERSRNAEHEHRNSFSLSEYSDIDSQTRDDQEPRESDEDTDAAAADSSEY